MRTYIPLIALLVILAGAAYGAHWSCTTTEDISWSVRKITWSWISNATGEVDAQTTAYFSGAPLGFIAEPAGGVSAPSADYDISITDENEYDLLQSSGVDMSAATSVYIFDATLTPISNDRLTLHIRAAGNANSGTVVLYLR